MQSPLRARNWIVFILVNIFVSALTSFIVVRAITQSANQQLAQQMQPSTAAVAQAPAAAATPVAADAPTAAASAPDQPAATTDAQPANVLVPVTPLPALTSAPQATQPAASPSTPANVRISTVVYPAQRTREAVVIVNEGDQVDMVGWTLSNPRGQTYTFGSVLLFKDSFINLHTTRGVDVPTDLFWNLDQAIWQTGDIATLKRGEDVMATFTVK